MDYFVHPTIATIYGWKTISFRFPDGRLDIPNQAMLRVLQTPPRPISVLHLLEIYELPRELDRELKDLLRNPNVTWNNIRKILNTQKSDDPNFKRVYNFVLHRVHGIAAGYTRNSEEALRWYSDRLIQCIYRNFCESPSDEQKAIVRHVKQSGMDTLEYLSLVMQAEYFLQILPYPYRITIDIKAASSATIFVDAADGALRTIDAIKRVVGDRKPTNRSQEYWVDVQDLCWRILERFPTTRLVGNRLKEFQRSPEARELMTRQAEADARSSRRWFDNVPYLASRPVELHQCVFCYRFRLEELAQLSGKKRTGHNRKTLHCDRPECNALKDKR
jgi:hypothetical protein